MEIENRPRRLKCFNLNLILTCNIYKYVYGFQVNGHTLGHHRHHRISLVA